MKRLVGAVLLVLVSQSALTFDAEARTRHHHRHHRHYLHRQSHGAAQQRVVIRPAPEAPSFFEGLSRGLRTGSYAVDAARGYLGMKASQVGVRATLWCSAFLRKVTGAKDVDDRALSWEKKPRIAPQVGAVVTMGRRGGGHVGIVSGFDKQGNPVVISGNSTGHRVTERVYPRSRIRAWVSPS